MSIKSKNKSVGHSIIQGTVTILFVNVLAKLTAFIVEAILAAYLGTTYKSDAYYMISSVQGVVYPMMSVGIWNVFLPLYKRHIARNELETANALTNKAITFFSLVSIVVVALLIAFAPVVVGIVAPRFDEARRELTIRLVRISAPMYVSIIAAAIYASMLQCHEKFFGSQIRAVASHIPTIIAAIFFYKRFGIEAMAVALIVSAIFRLLIEFPFVDWGYRYKPDFKFKSKEFILILKRLPSALISAGISQLNSLVDKAMASGLATGTISALSYGHKLVNVFGGMLSSAISTALYPQVIELIALNKKVELARLLDRIINLFALITLPTTLACVLFRIEIASAVYERGAFTAESTALTAGLFAIYCLCLFTGSCNGMVSNLFYANGDTRTPMFISLSGLAMNIVLNLIFIKLWGVNGLALSTVLVSIINFFVRLTLSKRYVRLDYRYLLVTGFKVLICSAVAVMIPRTLFWVVSANKFIVLIVSAAIGVPTYLLMVKLLKINELGDLITMIKKKLKKA